MPNDNHPPFATPDGKVPGGPTTTKGTDFGKTPAGQAIVGGARDFTKESRPQSDATEGAKAPDSPHLRSRPQQAGSPEQRTNPTDAAPGGTVLRADPGRASKAIGAQGLDRAKPFKLKGA